MSLVEENNNNLNRKATLLLGEILQMANRILPMRYAAQLQASTFGFENFSMSLMDD